MRGTTTQKGSTQENVTTSNTTPTLPGPAERMPTPIASPKVETPVTPESIIIAAFKDAETSAKLEAAKTVLYNALGKDLCNAVSTAQDVWKGSQGEDNKVPWIKASNALITKSGELMQKLANDVTVPQALKDIIAGLQWPPFIPDANIRSYLTSSDPSLRLSPADVKFAQTVNPGGRDTSLVQLAEQAEIQAKNQAKFAEIQVDIKNITSSSTQDEINAIKDKIEKLISAKGITTDQKDYLTKIVKLTTPEQFKAIKDKTEKLIKLTTLIEALKNAKTPQASKSAIYNALGQELVDDVSRAQRAYKGNPSEDNKMTWLKASSALSTRSGELQKLLTREFPNNPQVSKLLFKPLSAQWRKLPDISDDYIRKNVVKFSSEEIRLAQTVNPTTRDKSLVQLAETQAKFAETQQPS